MDTIKNPNINFPVISAFGAVIFTVILLIILSTLSNIYIPPDEIIGPSPTVVFDNTEPPKPLEPVSEVADQTQITRIKPNKAENTHEPPERAVPRPDFTFDGPVTMTITTIRASEDFPIPIVKPVFTGFQVDQQPVITRMIKPVYPFSAKSSGIEGRVVLRFIVDEKGLVQEPVVLEAEPGGVFEESALAAIVKYKFRPAKIGNRPVKCIVKMPIGFTLTE